MRRPDPEGGRVSDLDHWGPARSPAPPVQRKRLQSLAWLGPAVTQCCLLLLLTSGTLPSASFRTLTVPHLLQASPILFPPLFSGLNSNTNTAQGGLPRPPCPGALLALCLCLHSPILLFYICLCDSSVDSHPCPRTIRVTRVMPCVFFSCGGVPQSLAQGLKHTGSAQNHFGITRYLHGCYSPEPLALTPLPQSPVLLKASRCSSFFPALRKSERCLSPLQTLSSAREGLPSLVHSNVPSASTVPAL